MSLWISSEIRPVFVIEELFTNWVNDLTLRRSDSGGLEIIACSQDGTVKCLALSNQEIGNMRIATACPQTTGVAEAAAAAMPQKVEKTRRRITLESVPL